MKPIRFAVTTNYKLHPHHRALAVGAAAFLALSLAATGCSEDSPGTPGTGGSAVGSGGRGAGTGGTAAGTGGANAGTGGSSATSTGGATAGATGGAAMPGTGGRAGAGTGGTVVVGSGGASAGTGGASAGTGGTSAGTGGASAGPLCVAQAKDGACTTPTDSCVKNCGPKNAANLNVGNKALTCAAAVYAEGACTFAAGDMACFKVTAATAQCPVGTTSGGACTVAACMPCSGYADSAGVAKVGFCHCVNSKWSCGSTKEWPCKSDGTSTSAGGTGC